MSDQRFDSIVREFFFRFLEMEPVMATFFGVHEHDGRLPEGTRRHVQEEVRLVREFREEVESIPPESLSRDARIDRELALLSADLAVFQFEELRNWERADGVPDTVGEGVFLLLARDFAPLEQRLESVASRLEEVPAFESRSRELLSEPVRIWAEIALESTRYAPALFGAAVQSAGEVSAELRRRLQEAAQAASEAMAGHAKWLQEDVIPRAKEEFAIGREMFERLLELRGIEMSSDEILRLGWDYLERMERERAEIARAIDPDASPEEVLKRIKSRHPETFDELIRAYRSAMEEARRFVIERGIVTVPENERLDVTETPEFLRHLIPFAAYMPPAKFDPVRQGIYLVTPPATPEMFAEHSYASIENTSVHEAYPGHHLQFSCALENPSLVRLLSQPVEFQEGWAFYCEEMMKEQGFHDDPEHGLIMVNDLLWRAARIVLDVKLHRGEMSVEEAIDFLVERVGMDRNAAAAEVRRYTMTPTYPLSYLLGKHLIVQLRRELEERLGDRFDLRRFHDAMLYAGNLPWRFMRRVVLEEFGLA